MVRATRAAGGGVLLGVLVAALAAVEQAEAHSRLGCPTARSQDTNIKIGPCGTDQVGPLTEVSPGLLTVMIEESITHTGAPFRLSLSEDGDDGTVCNLLDHIPHNDAAQPRPRIGDESSYTQYYITVEIPDVQCDRCSLQLANPMTDKISPDSCDYSYNLPQAQTPNACNTAPSSVYHSCADLRINGSTPRANYRCPSTPPLGWPQRPPEFPTERYSQISGSWNMNGRLESVLAPNGQVAAEVPPVFRTDSGACVNAPTVGAPAATGGSASNGDDSVLGGHCAHARGATPCTGMPTNVTTTAGYNFCTSHRETCSTTFAGTSACLAFYEASNPGVPGQTAGATQACYDYHLAVAAGSTPDSAQQEAHCLHAMGVADATGVQPCIGSGPSITAATNFCEQYGNICSAVPGITDCVPRYEDSPSGVPGQKSGATQACFDYHLAVAAGTGDPASVHCSHAAGGAPCTGGQPTASSVTVVTGAAYNFCKSYMETCSGEQSMSDCMEWYNSADLGVPGQTSGATQACYDYHLAVATGASIANDAAQQEAHCQHAMGAAPCVGAAVVSSAAANFCNQYEATCVAVVSPFVDSNECLQWYNRSSVGVPGQKSGETQSCYDYHLAVAVGTGNPSSVHCRHATGETPCTGPQPTETVDAAYNFCISYAESCSGSAQFDDLGQCIEWYNAADVGRAGQTTGATQGCYDYHLAVAAGTGNSASVHCTHARGAAPCSGNESTTITTAAYNFCISYQATCPSMFNGTGACMSWYESAESGVAGQTSGANQACYDYHLAVAAGSAANPAQQRDHCQHAAGAADANGVAPCVGNISTNGTAASNFCDQFTTTCTSLPSIDDCVGWYNRQPVGVAGQKSGGTQSCYDYHVAVAVGTGAPDSPHCFHATGQIDPCRGDEPAVVVDDAYNFCFSYMETCAGATQFSDMGSCITWYSSTGVGIQGQKDGSTQSCYAYHLAVASGVSLASSASSSDDDDGGNSGATAAAVIIVLLLLIGAVFGYIYRDTIAVKIGLRSSHKKHGHQAHVSNPETAAAYELETTASTVEEKPAMPSRPPMPQRPAARSGSGPEIPARPQPPTVVDFAEPPVPAERQSATPRRAPPRRAAPRLDADDASEI